MPRLYLSPEIIAAGLSGGEFELPFEAAKKLTRVLRLTPGETFIAFDGLGREWECTLVAPQTSESEDEDAPRKNSYKNSKSARAVIIEEKAAESGAAKLRICVAQAIPKNDKMDWVLQKGTELGVAEFWPFEANRSVSRLLDDEDSERAGIRAERWRKICAQAAGQCGRADVPLVHAVCDFGTVVDAGTGNFGGARCLMLDENPGALSLRETLRARPLELPQDEDEPPLAIMLLIGPEGGWTPDERAWAERYGAESVHLGQRILRTETAALAAAAILAWEAGDFD